MGFHQPDDWPQRAMLWKSKAEIDHQIRLFWIDGAKYIGVSCVCLENSRGGSQGQSWKPLGKVSPTSDSGIDEAQAIWKKHAQDERRQESKRRMGAIRREKAKPESGTE